MALIECSECGGRVSDKAAACPHCGAPPTVLAPASRSNLGQDSPDIRAVGRQLMPAEQQTTPSQRSHGQSAATTGDKVLCFLFPILWLVVRGGGRKGAGPFALAGLGVGAFFYLAGGH